MDFKKEEMRELQRTISNATTTFAIFSELDKREDEATQQIRKKLREFTDKLFDLKDELNAYFEEVKKEIDK